MFRKTYLMIPLVLLLVIGVSACSGNKADADLDPDPEGLANTTPDPEPEVVETTPPPVEVKPEPVPILEDVFYDYDKSSLSSGSRGTLENNATQLKSATGYSIVIEGHCDERGTIAYNLALGEKRAKAAQDYLVSLGVASRQITVISYGKERPFATGHDEAAWKQNRRAHFVVSKN